MASSEAEARGSTQSPASNTKVQAGRGPSIRSRLLVLLLGLTTIAVLAIGYLGVSSVQRIGRSARRTSADALRSQAKDYVDQVTLSDVQKNDLILSSVEADARKLARYAARIFENRENLGTGTYWRADDRMFVGSDGQYMNGEEDVSSAFVPNFVEVDEETKTVLELGAYLDFVFAPTYEEDANTVAVYLGTEYETTQYYPNISLGSVVPPDFTVTGRPWYVSAGPEKNPDREVIWTPVYADATGKGMMVTAAAPVYANDEFIGAVGVDVTLKDIAASVRETRLLGSGYGFLIDDQGRAIVLPKEGYRDILGGDPEPGATHSPEEMATDLSGSETPFAGVLSDMMAGSRGVRALKVDGREVYVAYAPLKTTGWSLANVVETQSMLQALAALESGLDRSTRYMVLTRLLPLGAAILAVVAAAGLVMARRLTQPIQEVAAVAEKIGAGEWDVSLPRATSGEIGALSEAFQRMTEELRGLYRELEEKVAAQTRDLRQRAVQLETSARVAREAAAIQDVDQLLDETVWLISDRFDFYHAGIFLVDEDHEYAVLRAASSEGGEQMLARQHRLKVGEVGIVGYVAGTAEPRIALDVGQDAVFFDNPDLPNTRSEMALPLQARGELIGVLDVQSVEAAAFDDEDVAVLQTMADQVALAIDNARLLNEAEERVQEIQSLLRRESREGWEEILAARPGWGYVYDGARVQARTEKRPSAQVEEEAQLVAPLRVRGESVGRLRLRLGDRLPTGEEEALLREIVDRAGQALESARLFQQTQRALGETEALYRASEAIGAADSPYELLRAITDHVLTPQVDRCTLALVHPASGPDDPVVAVEAVWEPGIDTPAGIGQRWSVRERSGMLQLPILDDLLEAPSLEMGETGRHVFSDVATAKELDDVSRQVLEERLGIKAAAVFPLFAGQRALGLLLLQSLDAPYEFSDREIRLYQTLVDQGAVALEGMRLLEETRRRAERERLSAQISSRVWRSADVDAILRTAVRELGRSLQASDARIELEIDDGNGASGGVGRANDGQRLVSEGGGDGVLGQESAGRRNRPRGGGGS